MVCSAGASFFIERQRILKLCIKASDSVKSLATTPYKNSRETKAARKELKFMDRDLEILLKRCTGILRTDERRLAHNTLDLVSQSKGYSPKLSGNHSQYAMKLESASELLRDVAFWEADAIVNQQITDEVEKKKMLESFKLQTLEKSSGVGRLDFPLLSEVIDQSQSALEDYQESLETISATVYEIALSDSFGKLLLTSSDSEEKVADQATNDNPDQKLATNVVAQTAEKEPAASIEVLSVSETRELLENHTERYGYTVQSRIRGFGEGEKCAGYAQNILEKKLRLKKVITLLEKTSKALDQQVPILTSVPLGDWADTSTHGSRVWIGNNRKLRSLHGGSPLTFECMNMGEMVKRQAKMEARLLEKKMVGRARFLESETGG